MPTSSAMLPVGARWCSGLARWTSDLKVGGLMPSPSHRVVSLAKNLYPHIVSLHPGV